MQIAQFTAASLSQTRAEWIQTAIDLDIGELEYEVNLDWAVNRIDYKNARGDAFAYGIFEDITQPALAIVEVVYSQRPGPMVGMLKMLRVIMCPRFAPSQLEGNSDSYDQVLDIYAEAIIGTVRLTSDHKAKVVKIFGRNKELLQLLFALNERFKQPLDDGITVNSKMESRWLVISE